MTRAPTASIIKKPKSEKLRSTVLRSRTVPSTAAEAKKAAMDAKKSQGNKALEPITEDQLDSDVEYNSETEDYYSHPNMPSFISEIFKRLDSHDDIIKKLNKSFFYGIIDSLRSELANANATIAKLNAAAAQKESDSTDPSHHKTAEPRVEHMGHSLNGTGASKHASNTQGESYAEATAKTKKPVNRRPLSANAQKAAARAFTPASTTQGFKYIYIYTRGKEPRNVVRSRFRKIDINPARIIDIHFPAHQVMSLLIHNDYETDLLETLAQHDIVPLTNFDPKSGKNLNDIRYKEEDEQTRNAIAEELYSKRLINTVLRVTPMSLQVALTRSFLTQKWLTETQTTVLISHINPQKEKSPPRDTSVVDALFSGRAPNTSSDSQAAGDDAAMVQ
ncbi:hypothetical protein BDB01DRAFT_856015 [Pilobolus umbonatus]|nr:hypothetical protein BDB01DRAFT_856015 [Pilobolus umbonatus]